MTNQITASGFIVSNNDAIWGCGPTSESAWADFLKGMESAGVTVVDDINADEEVTNDMIKNEVDYTRLSDYKIQPATAELLAKVESHGGFISWGCVGGICCTCEEAKA